LEIKLFTNADCNIQQWMYRTNFEQHKITIGAPGYTVITLTEPHLHHHK